MDREANIDTVKVTAEINGVQRVETETTTNNYEELDNKPLINDVELVGNKTLDELGIQPKGDYVIDANYVHTDNNFSDEDKAKLDELTPGEDGATFTPDVSEEGVISWTNDKDLPNPDPVNIKGPKGDTGATGATGANGQGVPTGGTEGQVLAKNSATDFDTVWKTIESGEGFTELVGTEEEPYDLSTGPDEPGIYLIKGYYRLNPSSSTTYNAQGGIFLFNTLWNFENRQEADQNIARIMMDMNKGFRVKINNKTKNVANTYWVTYQLNPVNSISGTTGSTAESMSTALFVNLTGITSYTNVSSLQTTDKSSLIAAINELNTRLSALEGSSE